MMNHHVSPRKTGSALFSRRLTNFLPLLLLAGVVPYAQGNVITSCSTGFASPGSTLNSCTFLHDINNITGILDVEKTFTQIPGQLNVRLNLTNNIAGNNVPGIYDYTVTERIHNNSGYVWESFLIGVPNASFVGLVSNVTGFGGCAIMGTAVKCEGGGLASGSTLGLTFHIGTPQDQNTGAFALFETAAAPEPGPLALSGVGLIALGWWRRKQTSR